MRQHWQRYGRNFFTRHDYEKVASQGANDMMDELRTGLADLTGKRFGDLQIVLADDFSYTDPIDGSTSGGQGLRIIFEGGARIVYRLSGTGTEGATLRVYIERHEPDPDRQANDTQQALADLIQLAEDFARIQHYTGRARPDVIT